jgi:hypothetical protein
VSKNRQSNNRRTKEAVAIVVSRLCLGSSEMADCDRRDSAYCNKRYSRPATRNSLVVGMVIKSVGAHAISRRARQCDGAAESVLLSLLGGVKSERHVLGGREEFLARGCRGGCDGGTERVRESQHVADHSCPYQPFPVLSERHRSPP